MFSICSISIPRCPAKLQFVEGNMQKRNRSLYFKLYDEALILLVRFWLRKLNKNINVGPRSLLSIGHVPDSEVISRSAGELNLTILFLILIISTDIYTCPTFLFIKIMLMKNREGKRRSKKRKNINRILHSKVVGRCQGQLQCKQGN